MQKAVITRARFCKIVDILSPTAALTIVASVARRAAKRLLLLASSSNQPTSCCSIAVGGHHRIRSKLSEEEKYTTEFLTPLINHH
jgi:hypothetical protein